MSDTLSFGVVSYSVIASGFTLLALLLLTCWRGRLNGILFVAFCLVTAGWAGLTAQAAQHEYTISLVSIVFELVRNLVWSIFLIRLLTILNPDTKNTHYFQLIRKLAYGIPFFLILLIAGLSAFELSIPVLGYEMRVLGQVFIAIIGLSLVEQIFRCAKNEQRWGLKFFCFGMMTFYVFDFYLYSDALLFGQMDYDLWFARPLVYLSALILIFIAASRVKALQANVQISRSAVFYTTAILLTGLYLLVMSAGGFYLKEFGGEWGKIATTSFVFTGLLFLIILVFSGYIRARLRVFIDKHFLDYKYDYREQWLGLMRELSHEDQSIRIEERALQAISDIMDSSNGCLWVIDNNENYKITARIGNERDEATQEKGDSSLSLFLSKTQWVIDVPQFREKLDFYKGLELPAWIMSNDDAWLIIPLMLQAKLYGFVVLGKPRANREFNWEDIDLLKTAGKQIAIHLAQQRATLALVQARQFEAFNRFSAYVVHDLKNLVSQLALVVKNAEKHKHNPAFMDDAIDTVDNAVERMNRLLAQLRAGAVEKAVLEPISLCDVLQRVVQEKSHGLPKPQLMCGEIDYYISGDETRLISVIGHIVQNAQDATREDGRIEVVLSQHADNAQITVLDTGTGMTQDFINERLFKPFDTTKGLTGMGIGAHESRAFIEELGGCLAVKSEINKGTVITVELPLLKVEQKRRK